MQEGDKNRNSDNHDSKLFVVTHFQTQKRQQCLIGLILFEQTANEIDLSNAQSGEMILLGASFNITF